jgi:hypothetical protein
LSIIRELAYREAGPPTKPKETSVSDELPAEGPGTDPAAATEAAQRRAAPQGDDISTTSDLAESILTDGLDVVGGVVSAAAEAADAAADALGGAAGAIGEAASSDTVVDAASAAVEAPGSIIDGILGWLGNS